MNKNNDHLKQICKKSRRTLKKAIKSAKENWMKEEISKLLLINVDPFTAWQAYKKIQSGLSHHHTDSKLKRNDGTFTDIPEEQVKIQSDFFGKEIFGRNAPYDDDAINDLKEIETNTSMADPISLIELKWALKKAKNRKSPGGKIGRASCRERV